MWINILDAAMVRVWMNTSARNLTCSVIATAEVTMTEPRTTLEVVNDYDVLKKRKPLTEREIELLELESRLNAKIDVNLRDNPNRHPKAVYFILPNEFGDRFAFSSIKPNMNKYFMQFVGTDRYAAKVYTTAYGMLSFIFPLVGAALSDSYLGK
ncbi:hypothetical protein BGZ73_001260, partial [Actinomortierella ambigua]